MRVPSKTSHVNGSALKLHHALQLPYKAQFFTYDETQLSHATIMANQPPLLDKVNCWKCQHFATSWDPKMPYSCKLLGFKSQILPSIQVMNSDGRPCLGFVAKPSPPSR
jgi:hypothetical protein